MMNAAGKARGLAPAVVVNPETAIAIIGVGCRFPGASSPAQFWELLRDGRSAIDAVPADRFGPLENWVSAEAATAGKMMSRWMGSVPDLDRFDASFFGIAPREADRLDPQQRLVLEVAWEALEDAGVRPGTLDGSATGVFIGAWLHDYETRMLRDPMYDDTRPIEFYMTTGSGRYSVPGRLSYFLGAQGPSVSVDTACSSSLVAVHLACHSLRDGESTLAIAGGVNAILTPYITIAYSQSRMMCPDGRCKFGDASANGYVRSEGSGVVVLKRLDRALADGDSVRAVILGSAVNNDGRTSGYLATPGEAGQRQLLQQAYARAGVSPGVVSYVEAHGTGTPAGDPVELGALGSVLGDGRGAGDRCAVGSVKTNFGHTEGAAGVAGLIKLVLAMDHGELPASLHVTNPTPAVDWQASPLALQRAHGVWDVGSGIRVAGVSAFGIAGTNAHVVVAEPRVAHVPVEESPDDRAQLIAVSAHSIEALRARVAALASWLTDGDGINVPLSIAARTGALRRDHFPHRASVVARTPAEAAVALRDVLIAVPSTSAPPVPRRVGFIFPGQGSQWSGMAASLLVAEPVFAAAIDACGTTMAPFITWSLRDALLAADFSDDIDVIQPAIFAMQVALTALWRSWGVEPAGVAGHSMGELAAAHVAGVLSLEDACRIICVRSRLMRRVRGAGGMAVVELPESDAASAIAPYAGRLTLAALNSPRSTVIAGDRDALDALLERLTGEGTFAKLVRVDMASHSHHVDSLLAELRDAVQVTAPRRGDVPVYSTVRGGIVAGTSLDAAYWGDNLRQPVRLTDAVRAMVADGIDAFIEVSPHPVLTSALSETLNASEQRALVLSSMRRDTDGRAAMLQSLGALFAAGADLAWGTAFANGRALAALPTYPWQRERFWYDRDPAFRAARREALTTTTHPFLGPRIDTAADGGGTEWNAVFDAERAPWLMDHVVRGAAIVPATAILSALAAAADDALRDNPTGNDGLDIVLSSVELHEAVPLRDAMPAMRVVAARSAAGVIALQLRVHDDGVWRVVARATAGHVARATSVALPAVEQPSTRSAIDGAAHYRAMRLRHLKYGPAFRTVAAVDSAATHSAVSLHAEGDVPERRSTVLLDGALQGLLSIVPLTVAAPHETLVPVYVARAVIRTGAWPSALNATVTVRDDVNGYGGDVVLRDASGAVFASVGGVRMQVLRGAARDELDAMRLRSVWTPVALDGGASGLRGPWLVVNDGSDVGKLVAQEMRILGETVVEWSLGDALDITRSFPDATRDIVVCTAVTAPEQLHGALETCYDAPLRVLQRAGAGRQALRTLLFVTRGAVAVRADSDVTSPMQAATWGLSRVARHEQPTPGCITIDLDPSLPAATGVPALVRALRGALPDDELALRGDTWFASRVERVAHDDMITAHPQPTAHRAESFVAEIRTPGLVDSTGWRATSLRVPNPDAVEIQVSATGLNFRDVLGVLGQTPGAASSLARLGLECAGVVTRVGGAVRDVAVGDRVMAVAEGALGSHVLAHAALVVRIPDGIATDVASAFPIAFLTAARALEDVARLQRGERVLIHSAAGGVGLAAVQIAHRLGARIVATAGTSEKRALLSDMGVAHVFDSRQLEWEHEVMAATGGAGVDVILNSLAGAAIAAGLRVLAPYGRFIEIGQRDIFADTRIGMDVFRKQVVVTSVDLLDQLRNRPASLGALFRELAERLERRELTPLAVTRFAASNLADAFRAFLPGTHVGKLIVVQDGSAPMVRASGSAMSVRDDATYLITGGLGALGMRAALWLAQRGARHLLLVGRSEPAEDARRVIAGLRAQGVHVALVSADIAHADGLQRVVDRCDSMPTLRGVIHAAGVLDDGILADQTPERMRFVSAPKIAGVMQLATLRGIADVDFFVLYSSVAAALGTRGQANYAAANAALDATAHALRSRGIPATSIAFGPFAGGGLAAEGRRLEMLRDVGLGALRLAHADAALDAIAGSTSAHDVVAVFDAPVWVAAHDTPAERRRFAAVPPARETLAVATTSARVGIAERLAAVVGERQREDAMLDFVRGEVAAVLRTSVDRVEPGKALKALGIDSLTALELRNRLEQATALRLSGTLVFSYPTASAVAAHLLRGIESQNGFQAPRVVAPLAVSADTRVDELDLDALAQELASLDDDAVRRLLGEAGAGDGA